MSEPARDQLYGRRRGHGLRLRQQRLLDETLPRLRFNPADQAWQTRFAALWVEVGFGGGEHAQALAAAHPDAALIACEVFVNGICSLLGRLVPPSAEYTGAEHTSAEHTAPLPPNLRLWDQDARTLLRSLPDAVLDRLFLLFPDPWPKARHAARRFVCPDMVTLAARVLKPGGVWRVASDDPTYQDWVQRIMTHQPHFTATSATTRPDGWPPTRYEAKARKAGRAPIYWTFERT